MKNKISKIITAVVIVFVAAWCGMWIVRKTVAPKMKFQTTELLLIGSNTKTNINSLKGNVAIVSFFQTWCGPCIQEMYVFDELQASVNAPDFKILCISDEDKNRIGNLQSRFPSGKILFTYSKESLASLGVHVYPTTYLLNKKGEVVLSKLEGYDWSQEKETIKKLLSD